MYNRQSLASHTKLNNKKKSELGLTEVHPLPLFVAANIHRDSNPNMCVIVMSF
jgi:hypothetical protein